MASNFDVITICGFRHVVWQCKTCGVIATCPETVYDEHRAEGGYHFCPNGHPWGWSKDKSEREQLRLERDRLKQQAACLEDDIRVANLRVSVAEAATKRLQKRSSAGVCPCCNRTFQNMARHMKTKHPDVIPIKKNA